MNIWLIENLLMPQSKDVINQWSNNDQIIFSKWSNNPKWLSFLICWCIFYSDFNDFNLCNIVWKTLSNSTYVILLGRCFLILTPHTLCMWTIIEHPYLIKTSLSIFCTKHSNYCHYGIDQNFQTTCCSSWVLIS